MESTEIEEIIDIDSCRLNSDLSIISVIQKHKTNFFETTNFKEITDGCNHNSFGIVTLAYPIHRSKIIIILGTKINPRFPQNIVHLYDIEKEESIGSIKIKLDPDMPEDEIINVILANSFIFLVTKNRILMFNLLTLEHEFTFEDVYGCEGCITTGYLEKKIVLCYVSNTNKAIVKVNKIKILKNGLKYSQRFIATNFNGIQYIQISQKCKFLAVADTNGEKINVYSLRSYKSKKCLWRGYGQVKINGICFDPENKFLALVSSQKTLHIYPIIRHRLKNSRTSITRNSTLKKKDSKNNIEENDDNNNDDDDQKYYTYGKKKGSKFVGFLKSMRKKINNRYQESFARYKDDKVWKKDIMCFFFNEKKDVVLIDKNGKVLIVKFNKKNGGMCWIGDTKYLDTNN